MQVIEPEQVSGTQAVPSDRPLPPPPVPPAPPRPTWRRLLPVVGLGGALAAGCLYTALNDPNSSSAYPQCPLYQVTGLDCPGCGITRAVYALMQGDVGRAASHNLLFVLILPFVLYSLVRWCAAELGHDLPAIRYGPWMAWAAIPIVAVFAVVRNIPDTPLSWLDAAA